MFFKSISSSTPEDQKAWIFILENRFWDLCVDTFILIVPTVILSTFLGVAQAILICFSNIRYKKIFHFLFILPLAFPLYVLSFIYVGSFEYSGFIPTYFRQTLNFNLNDVFSIKSVYSISIVFSFAMAPYVYLFIKSGLQRMDSKMILVAKSLGKSSRQIVTGLLLPFVRPWIITSGIIVFLEILSDFGGVSTFNYDTFSTAIYQSWISLFSINTAIKLSIFPTIIAISLHLYTLRMSTTMPTQKENAETMIFIHFGRKTRNTILTLLFLYTFFSVLFPVGQLMLWSLESFKSEFNIQYTYLIFITISIGIIVSVLINSITLVLNIFQRYFYTKKEKLIISPMKIGYAIPGSIIGIAVMFLFSNFNISFYGSISFIALFLGLLIKFFNPSFELQRKSFEGISKKLDWSSFCLGAGHTKTFFNIHLPHLAPTLVTSLVIILVEVIKEMPIMLILRPYGINTVSTKIYELTSEGEWERAALSGLILIILGSVSIFFSEKYTKGKL
jgi:iron(III) transport system permease protein